MSVYVPVELRRAIEEQFHNSCAYCQTQRRYTAMPMQIDHIVPVTLQGATVKSNLCLACSYCNDSKQKRIAGTDPETKEVVSFFNPQTQKWSDHFKWSEDAEEIIGVTPTGRATVVELDMNRDTFVIARMRWAMYDWHPPDWE